MVRGGKRAAAVALLLLAGAACAQGPSWWTNRGVLDTDAATTNDFLFARLGQLKWFTTNAYDELEENLPGGAGTGLAAVVGGLSNTDNFYLVNLGQLKNLSQPVYARLIAAGYTNAYPWTTTTNDDFDYGLANLGQLKNVFSFDISTDTDEDGLADWWEMHFLGGLGWDASPDLDGDGWDNAEEYAGQADPADADTDEDGIGDAADTNPASAADSDSDGLPDDWEEQWFGDLTQEYAGDYDGDGVTNGEEYQAATDPTRGNVTDAEDECGLAVFTPLGG